MADEKAARRAVGEIAGECVLYDTWDPERDDLDPVHYAYVPLVPNKMQSLAEKMSGAGRKDALKLSVTILASQLRAWTGTDIKGAAVDPRDAKEIGARMDNIVVEGICNRILDARSSKKAQEALANFPKP